MSVSQIASVGHATEEEHKQAIKLVYDCARNGGLSVHKNFSVGHYILRRFIKSGFCTCMHRGVGHDIRDGMAIACLNRRIRLLTAANTFHPVSYMRRRETVSAGIGGRNDLLIA